ncbi:MAG: oligosaccharide flippase family protein [Candidatus Sungbacteria bacterium]|nr:oligosaccharide flippase family protein [Candidatus Sungbacteria bacterium]
MNNNIEEKENMGKVVIRGIAISGAGTVVWKFIDALTAISLLRLLSLFEYGVYRLALAAYEFMAGFFLAGLENVVVSDVASYLASDRRRAQAVFSFYIWFVALVSAVFFLLFLFGSRFIASWLGESEGIPHLAVVSLFFIAVPFETAYKLKFQIFLDFGWGNAYRLISSMARIVSIALFYFFAVFGAQEALWAGFASMLVPVLISLGYRRDPLFIIPSWAECRSAIFDLFLRHGKWAIASDFINNFAQNIRPFLVKAFVGIEGVALIALAQGLTAHVKSLFPLREILTPVLPRSADDPERLSRQLNRATKYATAANFILFIVAAAGAPVFVALVIPKYWEALPYFYLLLLGLPVSGFRTVAVPVFYALRAQQKLFAVTVSRTVAVVLLNAVFTYFFGLWGAASEMLLLGILTTPAYALAIKKALPQWKFSWKEFFSIDEYDRAVFKDIRQRVLSRLKIFKSAV